jgi:hypothetical protein
MISDFVRGGVMLVLVFMLAAGVFVGTSAQEPEPTPTILPGEPGPVLPAERDYWGMPDGRFINFNVVAGGNRIAVRTCTVDPSVATFRLLCAEEPVIMDRRAWQWLKHQVNRNMPGPQWR